MRHRKVKQIWHMPKYIHVGEQTQGHPRNNIT